MLWKEGISADAYNLGSYSNPNFAAILLSNNVKPNVGHDWVWWVGSISHGNTREVAAKMYIENVIISNKKDGGDDYYTKLYWWARNGIGEPVFYQINDNNYFSVRSSTTGQITPN